MKNDMKKLMTFLKKCFLKMARLISKLINRTARREGYRASEDALFI